MSRHFTAAGGYGRKATQVPQQACIFFKYLQNRVVHHVETDKRYTGGTPVYNNKSTDKIYHTPVDPVLYWVACDINYG